MSHTQELYQNSLRRVDTGVTTTSDRTAIEDHFAQSCESSFINGCIASSVILLLILLIVAVV